MKTTKLLNVALRLSSGSALAIALAGCTTYVAGPPPSEVYVTPPPAEQPPPTAVYVPPPPAQPPPPVLAPPPPPPEPPPMVVQSEADFYQPLTPYGNWVVVASYGRCWRPAHVEAGWRPYAYGHWQRTDAGWYWASDEAWGWATYHYGRWAWTVNLGWFWVPQTQWAPSWVVWREGGGYIGWAPLPPAATFVAGGAVEIHDAAFASRAFVFVNERRVLEPVRPQTVIVNNTTIVNQTVNITRIEVVNKTVVNEGPRPDVVERLSGRKLQPVPVHELRRKDETAVIATQPALRAIAERNRPPAVRGEAASTRPAGARDTRPQAQPTEAASRPQAPSRGSEMQNGAGRQPAVAGTQPPGTGTAPVTARPGVSQEPKPAALPRETRPVVKPLSTTQQPQVAATRNEAPYTVQPIPSPKHSQPDPGKPMRSEAPRGTGSGKVTPQSGPPTAKAPQARPETRPEAQPAAERPAAVTQPGQPASSKQVERPVRSPKDKATQNERGAAPGKKAGDEKKGREQELPTK